MPVGGKRPDLECQATDETEVAVSDPTILAAVGTLAHDVTSTASLLIALLKTFPSLSLYGCGTI